MNTTIKALSIALSLASCVFLPSAMAAPTASDSLVNINNVETVDDGLVTLGQESSFGGIRIGGAMKFGGIRIGGAMK